MLTMKIYEYHILTCVFLIWIEYCKKCEAQGSGGRTILVEGPGPCTALGGTGQTHPNGAFAGFICHIPDPPPPPPITSCPPGQFLRSNACINCLQNTYKNNNGANSCSSCDVHSTSPVGSDNVNDCTCNAGYSGESGTICIQCDAGKYSGD